MRPRDKKCLYKTVQKFSPQISVQLANIKPNGSPAAESPVLPRGSTDRQDEAAIKSRLRMPEENLSVTYKLEYICGRMLRKLHNLTLYKRYLRPYQLWFISG